MAMILRGSFFEKNSLKNRLGEYNLGERIIIIENGVSEEIY